MPEGRRRKTGTGPSLRGACPGIELISRFATQFRIARKMRNREPLRAESLRLGGVSFDYRCRVVDFGRATSAEVSRLKRKSKRHYRKLVPDEEMTQVVCRFA